jgi:hypothetical protein
MPTSNGRLTANTRGACITASSELRFKCCGLHSRHSIALCIGHVMKIFKIIVLLAFVVFVSVFPKAELQHFMNWSFWSGVVGALIFIGMGLMPVALKVRARLKAATETAAQIARTPRRSRHTKVSGGRVARLLAAYPGPVTLEASRTQWWVMMVLVVVSTAASIFLSVIAFLSVQAGNKTAAMGMVVAVSVFAACFGGWAIARSARALLRGALQLDRNGFQVILLSRKQYLWTEVMDFCSYRDWPISGVQFNAVRPRLLYVGGWNAWSASSNDALGDNYGLEAEELADLMESWQSAALDGQGDEQPLAPAVSE